MADAPSLDTGDGRRLVTRAVPAILAAAGLAHDMGNPPFGHQGEDAIRSWFKLHESLLTGAPSDHDDVRADVERLTGLHRSDFLSFEGNAQTIRALGRLQVVKDDRGLNLTFATLATLLKYTVGSDASGDPRTGPVATRKFGFYASEAPFVARFRDACGLTGTMRHPLTYLMEACEDIAYLVVHAEDAIKKRVTSFADLMAWLDDHRTPAGGRDPLVEWLVNEGRAEAVEARKARVPPSEVSDVAMQIFRANAITAMVSATIVSFKKSYDAIMTTGLDEGLLAIGDARELAAAMKGFDTAYAYRDRRVLEIELNGSNVINETMDMLWRGIAERDTFNDPASKRTNPFARYAYGRISENYKRVFEDNFPSTGRDKSDLPIRYRELQLLSDMIAGMTDRFAIDLHRELKAHCFDAQH